jgi:outer membrane autotransporter protein
MSKPLQPSENGPSLSMKYTQLESSRKTRSHCLLNYFGGLPLAVALLASFSFVNQAWADGGAGGGNGIGTGSGGSGGVGFTGAPGNPGNPHGGGGGGGAAGGGLGGAGDPGGGGPPVAAGGSGGNGGVNGGTAAAINNITPLTGGNGIAGNHGGNGGDIGGGGGGGGAGGYGLILTGGNVASTNTSTIHGGNGGAGGTGGAGINDGAFGGTGGSGGVGIQFTNTGALINNSGSIIGGDGGAGGGNSFDDAFFNGPAGSGGAGIVGAGLTVVNSGTISGGLSGNGARANAITFSGGTNTLTLQNSSIIIGNIAVTGSLTLDQTTAQTLSNSITGTGSVTDSGAGTLTLSGTNNYSGGTTLSGGTLVAGNAGALGSGLVSQNNGTLETDDVNHIISMGSGFDQTGGTLLLNLNGAPGAASNDQVNVTGTAALNGGLVIHYTAGALAPFQSETYTAITTTGGITSVNAAGYEPPALQAGALLISITGDVVGDNFDVTLTGTQTPFTSLAGTSFTPNQFSIASYLDRFDTTVSSGPLVALLQALDGISISPSELGPTLDQLTPLKFENFASTTAFNNTSFLTQDFDNYLASHRGADGTFVGSDGNIDYSGLVVNDPNIDSGLQMVHSRLLSWSPAPSTGLLSDVATSGLGGVDMKETKTTSAPEPTAPWGMFVSGNVVLAQDFSDSSVGTAHADTTTGGVQIGTDYRINPNFLVGALFGYGHTDATLDNLGSTASVDTYSPGVYASYSNSGWYANALGSYGFSDYDQDRRVGIGAFNGTAHSSPGGDQIVGNLDGGYDFHRGHWTFGPTLGVQYVHLDVDGFTETGLPGADLSVNRNESDSLRSSLGGRVAYAIQDGGMTFTPHFSATWLHEFLDQSRGVTSQFDGIGAGSFAVNTANPSRDSALLDLGFDAQIDKTWTVFTDYSVQAGQSNYFGQSVQAGVKIGF